MKETRVAIYTRVSTDKQSTGTQEHELRQVCAKHRGWTVQRIYTDHGFSGASEKRPALDELLRDRRICTCHGTGSTDHSGRVY